MNPCTCAQKQNPSNSAQITCGGYEKINLKNIFEKLSINLEESKKYFSTFVLNNTAVTELTENLFKDITFEAIEIREAYNLSHIHKNAFNAMINGIESLAVVSTPLKNSLPFYNIFTSISLMKNLKTFIIFNTSITEIPNNAFQPLNGIQSKLWSIVIHWNKLKKIGNNAFQNLPSLINLELDNNSLNHISQNAFNFSLTKPSSSEF